MKTETWKWIIITVMVMIIAVVIMSFTVHAQVIKQIDKQVMSKSTINDYVLHKYKITPQKVYRFNDGWIVAKIKIDGKNYNLITRNSFIQKYNLQK